MAPSWQGAIDVNISLRSEIEYISRFFWGSIELNKSLLTNVRDPFTGDELNVIDVFISGIVI